jgi:hypothetical protein
MATFTQESRYRGSTVTQIERDGELRDYVLLRKPLNVPLTDEDQFVIIDQGNQYRPDTLSQQVYGTPDYGWAIMDINNLRSFMELQFGIRVRIPPLDAVISAIPESNNV